MNSLIQELKRDLPKDKLQILNLLLAQLDMYDEQLKKIRTETYYQAQLIEIDQLMALDEKKVA